MTLEKCIQVSWIGTHSAALLVWSLFSPYCVWYPVILVCEVIFVLTWTENEICINSSSPSVCVCVFVCAPPFVEPDKEPARAERAECASRTKGWIWRASGIGAVWHCGEYNFLVTTGSAQKNTQYPQLYSQSAIVKHLQACTVEKFNFFIHYLLFLSLYTWHTCTALLSVFLQHWLIHISFGNWLLDLDSKRPDK